MPSEVSQSKEDKYCIISLMCGILKQNKRIKQKQIHIYRYSYIQPMVARGGEG